MAAMAATMAVMGEKVRGHTIDVSMCANAGALARLHARGTR